MSVFVRANIRRLAGYTPGEQPERGGVIKLNTNENPYPPAPAVMRVIRRLEAERLRRYPPPLADEFRRTAARVHGVKPEQIIATNGGDELLRLAVTAFCEVGGGQRGRGEERRERGLGIAWPSYSLYPVLARIADTPLVKVELEEDWSLPGDFEERMVRARCGLVMLVNPHAPSGRLEPVERLERIARVLRRIGTVLLIDEAYVDFAGRDALTLVRGSRAFENVLILRSLSKGYSLAGLRFGYGVGHPDLIAVLNRIKDSYPTDALAQAAAVAALESRAYAQETWRRVIRERQWLTEQLRRRGFQVPESWSNFILVAPPAGAPCAERIYRELKRQGILVRYFDQDRLRDKLRITIGRPSQNRLLLRALDGLLTEAGGRKRS